MYNPRVPTATLLIRVLEAPVDQATGMAVVSSNLPPLERDKHKLPVPEYKDGNYGNELLKLSPIEEKAINFRRRRNNPDLIRVIEVLLLSSGVVKETLSPDDLQR